MSFGRYRAGSIRMRTATRARASSRSSSSRIAIARPEQTLKISPGAAALEDQPVRAHRVANVGEIAARVEIADRDLRLPLARSMSAMRRAKPDAAKNGSCRGPK